MGVGGEDELKGEDCESSASRWLLAVTPTKIITTVRQMNDDNAETRWDTEEGMLKLKDLVLNS